MRQKIKKILNKEKGFTLVELLAVIVILGVIVAIAIPAVGSVLDTAEGDADAAEIALIEDAARLYVTTNANNSDEIEWAEEGTKKRIPVDTLVEKGYLEEVEDSEVSSNVVEVTRERNSSDEAYIYEYNYDEATATELMNP